MPLAEHLVGRTEELGSFDRLLTKIDEGDSAAVELLGEPGIGKTRLLAELAARADGRGHTVLSGCASELEGDVPFWVFVDALDEYLNALEPGQLEMLEDGVRAELATVFPSLAALGNGGQVAIQHERYRSHRAVRALLELLGQRQPVTLILDDVHWADPASVELLGALLHKPPAAVLLACAARPRQMGDRLSASLERALRLGTTFRSELAALTREEAGELTGESDEALAGLFAESGGNPFYLEQLARSTERVAVAGSPLPQLTVGGVDVPPLVAAALAEELGLLSPDSREVLEGAAVAGDPFDPDLTAAAAGVDEKTVLAALDELLQLELIRSTDVPRRFRFRHPLVRRTVYEASPGGWRIGAHERCAAALERGGASAPARARHVELSAREGDAAGIACLREAGEAATRRAPGSAAHWLGAALRLLPPTAPAEERIDLLLACSGALAAAGQFRESHAALLEGMELVADDADVTRVRLAVACANVEHLLGQQREALVHLEAALASLRAPESGQAVELMVELAVDNLYSGDFEAMQTWAAKAVATAASLDDRALLAAAFGVRAWAAALAGARDAMSHRDEAANLIDTMSDDELAARLDALAHLAGAEMYLDRFAASGHHARRGLDIGRATGQGHLFPLIVPMLGSTLWIEGKLAESADVFDGAIEAARLVGNVQGLVWNLFNRSLAAFAAGDIEVALATAEESFELAKELDEGPISAHAAIVLSVVLLELGDSDRCIELILAGAGGIELRLIGGGWRARYCELLTRAFLASGRKPEAKQAAGLAQARADEVPLPMARAMARLAAADLDLDAGRPLAAAEQALVATSILEEADDLYDAAVARAFVGRALAQAGERAAAIAELETAAEAFNSFGSVRHHAQAVRELRKLGRRVRGRTQPGLSDGKRISSLTARELEVARLVVDRKTNPEIAAELFLSPKTVESHLRNTFRKVGVSSRVELARAVERADRVDVGAPPS